MHLKRIELTNFRQHRKLDVDFSGNLIAVLGANGSGKSNLIGAIQFALTGEQPGFTKANLTTWGEKEGSVRLFFNAGNKNDEFIITRKTNGDVVLKVGDETIKQARKVEEALRDKAGLDKELIRQIVFVPQKGIDAILFDDPKNREVAFQRLIGIGNASKIYDAMRNEIANYDKPQGFDDAIARSRQQLSEQESVAKTCREALKRYEDALAIMPTKEDLEKEQDRLSIASHCAGEYITIEDSLISAQRSHEEYLKRLSESGGTTDESEEELRVFVDERRNVVKILERLKELSENAAIARDVFEKNQRDANDVLGKYEVDLGSAKDEVVRLESEKMAAESELRSLHNLEKDASSNGICPLCGSVATEEDIHVHINARISESSKKVNEIREKANSARMSYDKREREEKSIRERLSQLKMSFDYAKSDLQNAKNKNVDGVMIDMDTFDVSYKGFTPADCARIEEELNVKTRELNDVITKKKVTKELRCLVERYAAQIDLIMQQKKSLAEKLISMGIDPYTVRTESTACRNAADKARSNLAAYNGILRDMASEKGRLESAENTIAKMRVFIDDLVAKKEIETKVKVKVDTLKRVRDWFHYKEGPRIMSQNVMRDLTACVNQYLDQFCAPFVVEAEEEGFGFRCRFIDGRVMPDPLPDASLLSGGQKVALAIAFRMAIYMCFGCELGLLSLDEPTAYLDDASIGHLGELLEKVGAVARNKGLQILMATHEKGIMPYLDTKIDLGILKGEQY